jgi:hypothetical protein
MSENSAKKTEELLDDEKKLLAFVRIHGTSFLERIPLNWYFNTIIETLRDPFADEVERKDCDKRYRRLCRALIHKQKKLQNNEQSRDDFEYMDYIENLRAEQFYAEARKVCTGCVDGKHDYSRCEIIKRKNCKIIKKELGGKYESKQLSEYLGFNNPSKYVEDAWQKGYIKEVMSGGYGT